MRVNSMHYITVNLGKEIHKKFVNLTFAFQIEGKIETYK